MQINPVLIAALTILVAAIGGHLLFWLFIKTANIKSPSDDGIGKWLGYFERALVALFICLGLISQTVFIFAVKAAVLGYRLPDDKDHRKHIAEYMLLGTMISYFVALIVGICGRWFMGLSING
ncbi:MAG: hypothetical protein KKH94_09620 [Candidatus Omnitrophica bacterium]|nr:hypothetical protein [Candidatus Omnitrophota bacterium]